MVFESIVVEILNKFLGDYVENLDSSQLKIGIWGGKLIMRQFRSERDIPVSFSNFYRRRCFEESFLETVSLR